MPFCEIHSVIVKSLLYSLCWTIPLHFILPFVISPFIGGLQVFRNAIQTLHFFVHNAL